MYFDGASNRGGRGAGVVLVTPDGLHLPLALRLDFPATNNAAEYEALIFGLESLVSLGVRRAVVRGDSLLVISQALGTWEVREPALKEYKLKLDQLKGLFEELDFVYVPRSENTWADALASLASCANMSLETPVIVCTRTTPSYQIHMVAEDVEDGVSRHQGLLGKGRVCARIHC